MKVRDIDVMRRILIALTGIVLALLTAVGVDARDVAFAVFDGPYPGAYLNRLNLETGELTPVGLIGHRVTHIAFDSGGTLFGVDYQDEQLVTINVMGGAGSPVGSLGVELFEVKGLSVDADDRLWMIAEDDALGPSLYEIDRVSGAATRVAEIAEQHFGSLASRDGAVYVATDTLAVIDTSDGSVTPIPGSTLGIWWTRALDFDDSGTLWSLLLCGPCMTPFDVLITNPIDTATGTLSGGSRYEPHGTWGLAILRGAVFLDGFETGDTTSWSATVQ